MTPSFWVSLVAVFSMAIMTGIPLHLTSMGKETLQGLPPDSTRMTMFQGPVMMKFIFALYPLPSTAAGTV